MTEFVPAGYLLLKDAVDVVGNRLFDVSEMGNKAQAIQWLRNILAAEQIPASAIADNGQMYKVGAVLWRSRAAEGAFATGRLPSGNLRQAHQSRQEGTLFRRILVPKTDLEAAIKGYARPARKGRPRGAGGFAVADQPLLNEMRQMLKDNKVESVWAAADRVAGRAKGGGSLESKTKRLAKKYRNSAK